MTDSRLARLCALVISIAAEVHADGDKLLVEFRTAEHCARYLTKGVAAHRVFEPNFVAKSSVVQSRSNQEYMQRMLQFLASVAVVRTRNADSLRQLLRRDTNVVRVWSPLRYRLDAVQRVTLPPPVPLDAQWHLTTLRANDAWKLSTGEGVIIGVVDTGVDWEHPAFENSLWINPHEDINGNGRFDPWPQTEVRNGIRGDLDGLDNDGNGYVDDVIGYSFVDRFGADLGEGRGPFPADDNGHGTAVSALIVARSTQGAGLKGLAYGAKTMVLRAFNLQGIGEEDDIAAAIVYAVLNGARVINCSFGDIVRSRLIAAAIELARAADVVVVASSGNSGSDLPHYPSDEMGVLSIGASTQANRPAIFSSYGERLFLLAPGNNILTAGPNGRIDRVSGTSFAAALVSATVALLRAFDPTLNSEQIRTILAESASPITAAWQRRIGHGIVSPLAALERAQMNGLVRITSPPHLTIVPQHQNWLKIGLDAVHPLLERWELLAAHQDSTVVLVAGTASVVNYRREFASVVSEKDSSLVLRLRAILRTGKTIEDAVVIERASARLSLEYANVYRVWHGPKRRIAVVARANRRCELLVTVEKGIDTVAIVSGSGEYRRYHALLLPQLSAGTYRLRVAAYDDGDTTITVLDSVAIEYGTNATAEWNVTSLSAEPLLLSGSFVPQKGRVVATRAQYLQHAIVLDRSMDTFRIVACTQQTLFLRGYGDVNGDGWREVLTYDAGDTRLYTYDPVPFRTILWGDTVTHTFWAAALADITRDGRSEILGFRTRRTEVRSDGTIHPRSDALVAIGWHDGAFIPLDSIEFTSPPQAGRAINTISAPLCAVGDFDGDGAIEVAYADSDGELEIAAWNNGRFVHEFTAPPPPFLAGAGTEFVGSADVDGDGYPEILSGAPAFPAYNSAGEYEPPLWRFVLFKAVAPDRYAQIWEEYFWGVQYGRPYYNGIATGDLTNDRRDEVVLTLFPFAYVFSWQSGKAELLFVRDSIWSNGALIADLDGNGKPELGLVVGMEVPRTRFFEFAPSGYSAPCIVEAFATPEGDIVCKWTSSAGASYYRLRLNSNVVAETPDTVLVLTAAATPACTRCELAVQAWSNTDTSRWSLPVTVVRTTPLVLLRADTVETGATILRLATRGYLPSNGIPPYAVRVEKDGVVWKVDYTVANGFHELVLWLSRPVEEGVYTVHLRPGTLDFFGNPSPASSVLLYVRSMTQEFGSFYAERVLEVNESFVSVQFNQVPDLQTLELGSIVLQPYGGIARLEMGSDSTVVRFIFDERYSYQARGFVYTMTFPPSFHSRSGVPINTMGGNTVAWFYPALSATSSKAFPQPFSRSNHSELRFSQVPLGAVVIVTTLDGIELARIPCEDPAGGVRWKPELLDGTPLPVGIYLYRIRLADGKMLSLQKFVVVP